MGFLRHLVEDVITSNITTNTNETEYFLSNSNNMTGNLTDSLLLGGVNGTSSSLDSQEDDPLGQIDWATCIIGASWCLFLLYCCCQPRAGTSTEQGDRIRRIARERWAENQIKKEREAQHEDQRKEIMRLCMRKKRVISKNERGDLTLGPVDSPPSSPTSAASSTDNIPESPGHATLPANKNNNNDVESGGGGYSDNVEDEEEQECVICLDTFEVGDVVSWSRHSETCNHVYHSECIEPWLIESRQDDCPSCRSKLIMYNYNDHESPTVRSNLENLLSISFDDEDLADEEEEREQGGDVFKIVHGLISRAARRTSYALVGTDDSMDEEEEEEAIQQAIEEGQAGWAAAAAAAAASDIEGSSSSFGGDDVLSKPSRFRRVLSIGSAAPPIARRSSSSSLLTSPSSIRNLLVMPRQLFPEAPEMENKKVAEGEENIGNVNTASTHHEDCSHDDDEYIVGLKGSQGARLELQRKIPLRRVVSDIGLSPCKTVSTADSSSCVAGDDVVATVTDLPSLAHPFGRTLSGLSTPTNDALSLSSGGLNGGGGEGQGLPARKAFAFLQMKRSESYQRQILPSDDDLTADGDIDNNVDDEEDELALRYSEASSPPKSPESDKATPSNVTLTKDDIVSPMADEP